MSKKQIELNAEIATFIQKKDAEGYRYSVDDIEYIQQFTGAGGLGSEARGGLFEYYTPDPIIRKMWAMVYDAGFTSGKILEPSAGPGRFIKYADPETNTVVAYEFSDEGDNTSFRIGQISYPWCNWTNDYFETIFYKNGKRTGAPADFDLVIGNPPYGIFKGFYTGKKLEGKVFPGSTYDQYFIWAGLTLLKPGGLLCFIVPSSFLDNSNRDLDFKTKLADMADLLEAYRMPFSIFLFTDVQTDIILFRKK